MQADLREFLAHLLGTIVAALIPVAWVVFTMLPTSLHHHIGMAPAAAHAAPQHMT